jgi:predicted PurR-regulated permease PerM
MAKAPLVILAVLAVLFAMREAQSVVIPVLMAGFLAVVADVPVAWLHRRGVPRIAAILLVVTVVALLVLATGVLVGSSLQQLAQRAPEYQHKIRQQVDSLLTGVETSPLRDQIATVLTKTSPEKALGLAVSVLGGVGDLFGRIFVILLLMILMIVEAPSFEAKAEALGSSRGSLASLTRSVRGYLAIKSVTSLATGIVVGLLLAVLGVDFAALWGLLAFLFNYVPTVGSILAAVPPVLLGLIQSGPGLALAVLALYLVVNLVIGNVLEPRIMGEGLGLSTFVVLLSLLLWGWVLGPIGMLLSVPLTTAVKMGLETNDDTKKIAQLLGRGAAGRAATPTLEDQA